MSAQPFPLTTTQQSRVDFARRELDEARAADLASMPASALIMQVERLRGRLDDLITLVDELTD